MQKINLNLSKINLNKRQIIITISVVIILIGVFLIYRPLAAKIKRMDDEYKTLEQQTEAARNIIKNQHGLRKKGRFLTREEVSLAIDEITKAGRALNINFVSIHPEPLEELTDFSCVSLPIRMDIESQYKDIGLFLGALEELDDIIVTVRSLEISRDEKILPSVKSSLAVEMYLEGGVGGEK